MVWIHVQAIQYVHWYGVVVRVVIQVVLVVRNVFSLGGNNVQRVRNNVVLVVRAESNYTCGYL